MTCDTMIGDQATTYLLSIIFEIFAFCCGILSGQWLAQGSSLTLGVFGCVSTTCRHCMTLSLGWLCPFCAKVRVRGAVRLNTRLGAPPNQPHCRSIEARCAAQLASCADGCTVHCATLVGSRWHKRGTVHSSVNADDLHGLLGIHPAPTTRGKQPSRMALASLRTTWPRVSASVDWLRRTLPPKQCRQSWTSRPSRSNTC